MRRISLCGRWAGRALAAALVGLAAVGANDPTLAASASTSPDDLQWRLNVSPQSIQRPAPGEDQRNATLAFSVSCRADDGAEWQSPPTCGDWSANPGEPSDRIWIELDPGWSDDAPADQAVKGADADFGAANVWGQPGGDARVIRGKQGIGGIGVVAHRESQPSLGVNVRTGDNSRTYIRFNLVTPNGAKGQASVWLEPSGEAGADARPDDERTEQPVRLASQPGPERAPTPEAAVTGESDHCDSQASPALIRDCRTLLGLKDALDPDGTLNWAEATALRLWDGVFAVTNADGVTQLNLTPPSGGSKLTGKIPDDLGDLAGLQKLYLTGNALTGSIPDDLGDLTNLELLHLDGNKLSGSIPDDLGDLTKLTTLRLNDNLLDGKIPSDLGKLTSLTELWLHNNFLDGALPKSLGNLTSLTGLNLGDFTDSQFYDAASPPNNQLEGPIPAEWCALKAVSSLDLRSNRLTGAIPSCLGEFKQLRGLYLSHNRFKGRIPAGLGGLPLLSELVLQGNQLNGPIPAQLGSLPSLTVMSLANNDLEGPIPSALGDIATLQWLILDGNRLTGEIPSELGQLSQLIYLTLGRNDLDGTIPESLASLPKLQLLYLHCNDLSGGIPNVANGFPKLESLLLQGNPLTSTSLSGRLTEGTPTTQGLVYFAGYSFSGTYYTISCGGPRFPQESATFTVSEGTVTAAANIGRPLTATDPDVAPEDAAQTKTFPQTLTYTLTDEGTDHADAFDIDAATGQLLTKVGQTYARAAQPRYQLIVTVADGTFASDGTPRTDTVLVTIEVASESGPPSDVGSEPRPPSPRRESKRPILGVALTASPDPVSVGDTITYTFTVSSIGQRQLRGVFWRSPELDVARRPVDDETLEVGEDAVVTVSWGPVTAQHLPGPIIITFVADSDQTHAVAATHVAPITPRLPLPALRSEPSTLALRVVRVRFAAPDTHLAHNLPDLILTLTDGEQINCDFLTHYNATGGLERWGHTISEVLEERAGALTQYYQRGVVDCHYRDGAWRLERRLAWDHLGGGLQGAPDLGVEPDLRSTQPGEQVGPWGHRVSNYAVDGTETGFLDVFTALGGVASLGYPKTEARYDNAPDTVLRLPAATPGFIRQYFQAAILEYHPDTASPAPLALLGHDLRDLRYPDQTYRLLVSFGSVDPLTEGQIYIAERVVFPPAASPPAVPAR